MAVIIKRNTNGDSRVADNTPTFGEFESSNKQHIRDVDSIMSEIGRSIERRGEEHDWTKWQEPYQSMFYRDMCNSIEGLIEFDDGTWNTVHYNVERHHLNRVVPEDVNLIDVIEMICDCVTAGLARSGEVQPITLDSDVLQKAFQNTVEYVTSMCSLERVIG